MTEPATRPLPPATQPPHHAIPLASGGSDAAWIVNARIEAAGLPRTARSEPVPRPPLGTRLRRTLSALQPWHRWITLLCRAQLLLRGTRPGPRFFVHGHRPRITGSGRLHIAARVNLRADVAPVWLEIARDATLQLGERAFLNSGVQIICHAAIAIGPDCRIAPGCVLSDTNHHPVHEGSPVRVAPIRLGRNVWLGRGVIVLPGVTIGDHAVVAAGSVVCADIPAGQVWRGNPAVYVKDVRCSAGFVRP